MKNIIIINIIIIIIIIIIRCILSLSQAFFLAIQN